MVKIAVFASGNGGNFQRIVEAQKSGEGKGYEVKLLIVDKESAYAIERAKVLGIPYYFIDPKEYSTKMEFEEKIIDILKESEIEYIVLAGYMRIISPILLEEYFNKIINIHPAYLPEFPGKDGVGDAYKARVSKTGVTIHYVDSGVDTGEIIYQERLKIDSQWGLEDLKNKIHEIEHRIYPMILTKLFKKGE
ncbi:MAG: phosphoribosylglycinamide formyltransferase [Cetobacterium sp.]|uniref:phosphoribosylglycinamide formyltransferase n=1 Tax=Cetobacterium sp. TaxID=2071632 RepID=UPI003F3DF6AA